MACGAQPEPHHVKIKGLSLGGMGMKAPDLFTIPLCREHHDELHRDIARWEETYGPQYEHLIRTLDRALRNGAVRCE